MKRNDLILIAGTALYSALFYRQSAGINFFIFNLALICFLGFRNMQLLKERNWLGVAIVCLLTSICVAWYGNALSVFANFISLSLLSGLSISLDSSVIIAVVSSLYSYLTAPLFMFLDQFRQKKSNPDSDSNGCGKKIGLMLIPMLISLVFFFLYRESSLLFDELVKSIKLDFISFDWFLFSFGGFILMYGFFQHKSIGFLSGWINTIMNLFLPAGFSGMKLFKKQLNTEEENFSGKALFIMLNLLLLIVNSLDINYLLIGHALPKGISYSDFVHQGTGTLIFSIIVAIGIILYYFRGGTNNADKNIWIKYLAYFWIAQNIFMLISTWLRNDMYIYEYGLTYKRIGVFVYLVLTSIGLITTLVKIVQKKNNNYLLRINGWLFYCVLVVSALFNWNKMIYAYNVDKARQFDLDYLIGLSDSNLPQLFSLFQDTLHENQSIKLPFNKREYQTYIQKVPINELRSYNRLSRNLYQFENCYGNQDWQSRYFEQKRIHHQLLDLNAAQKISIIDLQEAYIESLEPLWVFNNISELYLKTNRIQSINEILNFKSLKKLDLSFNLLQKIEGIESLKNLEYLDLRGNDIIDYSPLYSLLSLKELYVSCNIEDKMYDKLIIKLPNTRILKSEL
jgi:hypothetical protein